jgi:uncharacterized protein YbaP (TraB family)
MPPRSRSDAGRDRRPGRTRAARAAVGLLLVSAWAAAAVQGAQPGASSRSFIWNVQGPRGAIYLVGSVHLLSREYYPLSAAMERAFGESDLLVEEIDFAQLLAPESQMLVLQRGMLPAGDSLDAVVSDETLAAVRRHLSKIGLPFEPLRRFKPWSLSLMLLGMEWQGAGFEASLGLDRHFYDRAVREGKAVLGLETVEFQISRFDGLPMELQDLLLASTLKELEGRGETVRTLADAWKAGDASTVERIVLQDLREEPVMYQRLLVERNGTWLPRIEALLERPLPAFVVVGAAHLVGPDGLLAMLLARGYRVEQL